MAAISGYPARRKESRAAVRLAGLNDEMAAQCGLEPKDVALAEKVIRLITEQPGGCEGFLEKLKASGGQARAPSWLGRALGRTSVPLTVRQVKKLVGTPFIKEVAKYLEIPQGFASKVLGAAIPKIAPLLAAQNSSSGEVPADARVFANFFALAHSRGRAGVQPDASKGRNPLPRLDARYVARLRIIVPVATLLLTGALLGYATALHTATGAAASVINGANAAAPTCPLAPAVGASEIAGDFAVRAGWTKNLAAEIDRYDSKNAMTLFAGNILTMQRTIPHTDHSARTIGSPQSGHLRTTHAGSNQTRPHRRT
jgi:uncharacterized protein YidB (DUF937 family)